MLRSNSICLQLTQWLVLLLLVGGCANRNLRAPIPTIDPSPPFSESGSETTPNRWWTVFGDSGLDTRIEGALQNNFTLHAATRRVQAARALTEREASDFWPDIDGILGFNSNMGPGENRESYNLGLDANYQVDLWGEIESRVDAQRFRADATCWDYHAVSLALSAEITSVWFSLIEAHAQAELLEVQIETNETGLELQEQRFGLGLIRSADVLRQRQLLESTLEQAVVIESRVEVLDHQLAVLLGEMPQLANFEPGTTFPDLPPLPTAGLPANLLLRRPDIQRDYHALLAADKDLASAISAQYPRLNLGGSLQNIAENPGELLKDWFASIGGQLIAPLFDGGQRRAEVDRRNAIKYQLFSEYAQSVLLAYQEVEDALAQEKFQLRRIEHLESQVKLAGQASNQLREQYLIGDAAYLDVLNAITGQQGLQRRLLGAQLDLRLIRVQLYLALAGNINARTNQAEEFELQLLSTENVSVGRDEPINAANLKESKAVEIPDVPEREVPLLDRLRGTTTNE